MRTSYEKILFDMSKRGRLKSVSANAQTDISLPFLHEQPLNREKHSLRKMKSLVSLQVCSGCFQHSVFARAMWYLSTRRDHHNVILSVQFPTLPLSCCYYLYQIVYKIKIGINNILFILTRFLTVIFSEVGPYLLNTASKYVLLIYLLNSSLRYNFEWFS